jgi:hypothetical protein
MRAKRPGESALLLLDVADVLRQLDVHYAAVGALAAAVHGLIRATRDTDAVISLPAHRIGELELALRRRGFVIERRDGDAGDPIGAFIAVTDAHGNRVELLSGLRGLDPAVFLRAVTVPYGDAELRVAGLEDFLSTKLNAGGPQDLLDAARVMAAAGGTIDMELLRSLSRRFGAEPEKRLDDVLATLAESRR